LLEELYEVISFEEGDEPNWTGLQALFSEHAQDHPHHAGGHGPHGSSAASWQ
jgi:hypothetical protein